MEEKADESLWPITNILQSPAYLHFCFVSKLEWLALEARPAKPPCTKCPDGPWVLTRPPGKACTKSGPTQGESLRRALTQEVAKVQCAGAV